MSITETEFVQLLNQTRNRFSNNTNNKLSSSSFLLPSISDIKTTEIEEMENSDDRGLIMKIDSASSAVSSLLISPPIPISAPIILATIPQVLIKTINKISVVLEERTALLLPYLLYSALFLLGLQALGVILILLSSTLPLGIYFLLLSSLTLAFLFIFTSSLNSSLLLTPPPTPSQSSSSLSSHSF